MDRQFEILQQALPSGATVLPEETESRARTDFTTDIYTACCDITLGAGQNVSSAKAIWLNHLRSAI